MLFSKDSEDIGQAGDQYGKHDIKVTQETPIRQRAYRTPYAKEVVIDKAIEPMLKMGVIEPSERDWASPIVLVKKHDVSERFCVDYRKVNEITIKDSFLMPSIESKLNKVHGCQFFTSLDSTDR
jgi:hypothetical protein